MLGVCHASPFVNRFGGPSRITDRRAEVRRIICPLDGLSPLCEYALNLLAGHNMAQKDIA